MIPQVLFMKKYHGFEDVVDIERDIYEAIQDSDIPAEFQGVVEVTITYKPEEN